MHDHAMIFFGAFLLLVFGLVSKRSEHFLITGPMFFLGVGVMLGPVGFGVFSFQFDAPTTKLIAEIALIIILFVDATKLQGGTIRSTLSGLPARLLLVGLPITIVAGVVTGWVIFPDMNIWLIVLLALILAPTDAALGQAVVNSEDVPAPLRTAISVESGLNDGIVLPMVLVCIAALVAGGEVSGDGHWLTFMALQLTLGPIVGAAVGHLGGKLVDQAVRRGWMEPAFQSLSALSLALLAYACAELVHGNGFIAAFFAGLFLGAKSESVRERIQEFGEAEGQILTLYVFLILGLVGVPYALANFDTSVLLYAGLSLTVLRVVPVLLSLVGSGLDRYSRFYVGWFGPRGIASVLYLLIAYAELEGEIYAQAFSAIIITVVLSTVLHGVSAVPLSRVFRK